MKSLFVADLPEHEGQVVTSFFLVEAKNLRSTREGNPYLALRLVDRTGAVEARMWDGVAEVEEFERNDVVKVEATVEPYKGRTQLKIRRLRRAQPGEADLSDYLPRTACDVEELYGELVSIAGGVSNEHLRQLLLSVLEDPEIRPRLKQAPGAKTLHHAYLGGLVEHVVSLCRLSRLVAPHYAGVDLDLVLTGAILHDLGKIYELSYERSLDYTTEGNLVGHIAMELELVGRKMDALPGFPPRLRTLVQHLILSHHGRLEFGSPVTPKLPEALLLHYLDDLDSKMEAMRRSLAAEGEGEWTEWNRSLERPLLRREKFLAGEDLSPATPAAAGEPPVTAPLFGSEPDKK